MNNFEKPEHVISGEEGVELLRKFKSLIDQGYTPEDANKEIGFEIDSTTGEYVRVGSDPKKIPRQPDSSVDVPKRKNWLVDWEQEHDA